MSTTLEIAVTTDASEQIWSCCAWDIRAGTSLMTYRGGGGPTAHTLCTINNEFLVTANLTKPILHVWPINSSEQLHGVKLVLPGRATALAISPDGNFCVAGIQENIYVWQISSGNMLVVLQKHYQPVTSIKFIDDGSHFVSAGQDGMVLVWNLGQAYDMGYAMQQPQPLYTFSDHSLPVTGIYVGKGGMRALLASVSADRTCKIYDLSSGTLLLNLVFPEALTAIVFDQLETTVFVGTSSGAINSFSIQTPSRQREYHMTAKDKLNNQFLGHTAAITCLSVSLDGETLMSGSADENVNIWNIQSKQVIRTLPHKGAITNVLFMFSPKSMFEHETKLLLLASNFQRQVKEDAFENHTVEVFVGEEVTSQCEQQVTAKPVHDVGGSSSELEKLRAEIVQLKQTNKELFEFGVQNILKM